MRLLVFGHVDGDDVLLTAIKHLSERQSRFGFTNARSPREHEDTNGFRRVVEARTAGLNALGNHLHGVILTDHALGEVIFKVENNRQFIFDHLANRNARPVTDNAGDGLLIDNRQDQRVFALQFSQFSILGFELFEKVRALLGGHRAGFGSLVAIGIRRIHWRATFAQLGAQIQDACNNRFFRFPLRIKVSKPRFFLSLQRRDRIAPVTHVHASRLIPVDDLQLCCQRINALTAIIHFCRHRVLAHRNPRAGCVEHTDRFVGQLPRRDIAGGQGNRRFDAFIEHLNLVVPFEHRGDAAHHHDGLWNIRLIDLNHLETPR